MMSQHKRVEYACFLCGDKFASELDKDYHMGSCSKADGPNSLDHSWEDPVRALFRQPVINYSSPSHPIRYPSGRTQIDDFSAPVGSTRVEMAPFPQETLDYTQDYTDLDMRRRIHFSFKSKPTPAGRDPPSQAPQITPYTQGGPKNQLFQNSNILAGPNQPNLPQYTSSAPLPESTPPYGYSRSQLPYAPRAAPPPPPTALPFDQSHTSVIRQVSEPSSRDNEIITLPPYDKDFGPIYKPEVELVKRHHVPPAQTYTREMMGGVKFEVKLVWKKQQPTLETTLEYLDVKDTNPVLLKWEYRKEAFIASARLSAGEHRGSLAIPDSDAVVYEVQPFNVSQFSVSVQEIKLDLVDIAPKYRNVSDVPKGPVYSQIDLASKRLSANLRRDDQTQFLGERKEPQYFQNDRDKIVALPGADSRDKYFANRVEVNLIPPATEHRAPLPIEPERPITPPKYRGDNIKYQPEISPQTIKPFKIVREERRATLSGTAEVPPILKSTQPRHEDRNQTSVTSPLQDQPLPPPRHKHHVIPDKSLEDLEQKKQTDALVAKLIAELASVRTERERVEVRLETEVKNWQNEHENINKVNVTLSKENESLTGNLALIRKEVKDLEDRNFALVREIRNKEDAKLQQAEKQDNAFAGKFKNLLEESQKKIQNLQSERDSYKAATYKYRGEREKVKQSLADACQQLESLTNTSNQLKEQNNVLTQENNRLKGELARSRFTGNHNNNNREHVFSPPGAEKNLTNSLSNFRPVRATGEESGPLSLSSIEQSYEKKPVLDKYGGSRPAILTKKPSITRPKDPPEYYSPTFLVTAPAKKLSSVKKQVEKFEGKPQPEPPVATPRYSKSLSVGLQTYQPEILSSSLQKYTSVIYKSFSVKTTKLSYLQRPESHLYNQVLVKIQEVYRLGTLQKLFQKKFNFPSRTRVLAGIKLDEAVGNSNGIFDSIRYFDCEHNHAIFISVEEVLVHVS